MRSERMPFAVFFPTAVLLSLEILPVFLRKSALQSEKITQNPPIPTHADTPKLKGGDPVNHVANHLSRKTCTSHPIRCPNCRARLMDERNGDRSRIWVIELIGDRAASYTLICRRCGKSIGIRKTEEQTVLIT